MTDRELLESMNNQIGELVRHVGDIRQATGRLESRLEGLESRLERVESRLDRLEARFDSLEARVEKLEADVSSLRNEISLIAEHLHDLDKKIDHNTAHLSSKIDHFIDYLSAQQTRDRNLFEEERHLRTELQRRANERFELIEQRLTRLESLAETPSPSNVP